MIDKQDNSKNIMISLNDYENIELSKLKKGSTILYCILMFLLDATSYLNVPLEICLDVRVHVRTTFLFGRDWQERVSTTLKLLLYKPTTRTNTNPNLQHNHIHVINDSPTCS